MHSITLRTLAVAAALTVPPVAAPADRASPDLAVIPPGLQPIADPHQGALGAAVPVSASPVKTEGRIALFYELHLTNFTAQPLVVQSVRVLDGDVQNTLATFEGLSLTDHLSVVGAASDDRTAAVTITPGARAILFVELFEPLGSVPRRLRHDITYSPVGGPGVSTLHASVVAVASSAPLVLGPPFDGGVWVSVHSPEWPRGHRRVTYTLPEKARIPGRFAIDWMGVDEDGRTTRGDPDRPTDAIGYGMSVLAGADGVVAAARDDMAEGASIKGNRKHVLGDGAGNYVAIKVARERYVFYEHLRPGSVRVRAGQAVHRGDVIAALGFTGDSTGPHLHLHVADTPDPLRGEGLPFVVDHYDEIGRYADIGDLSHKKWQATPLGADLRKSMEWPGSNVVVRFARDAKASR
jgi:murein DD-endopeptidase